MLGSAAQQLLESFKRLSMRKGDGHTSQKALGPADFVQLCDLHMLALFVQTRAGWEARNELSAVTSLNVIWAVVHHSFSRKRHSQRQPKEHLKGEFYFAPTPHHPSITLMM